MEQLNTGFQTDYSCYLNSVKRSEKQKIIFSQAAPQYL
jgi:hypothetical protein